MVKVLSPSYFGGVVSVKLACGWSQCSIRLKPSTLATKSPGHLSTPIEGKRALMAIAN